MSVSAFYKNGTISVTNSDATVTGSGTAWTTATKAGDELIIASTGLVFEIASVTSDTELELTAVYPGVTASGLSYRVRRSFAGQYAAEASRQFQDTLNNGSLAAYAGQNPGEDEIVRGTGSGTAEKLTMTDAARDLIDDTSYAAMRTTLGTLSGVQEDKSAGYEVVADDVGKTIIHTDAIAHTFTFEAAVTLGTAFFVMIKNEGTGTLTLDPDGSETIDGVATIDLEQNSAAMVMCDGTSLRTLFTGTDGADGAVRRNRSTNPVFQESQENGDTAGTTDNYYPADEWRMQRSISGAVSIERVQDTTLSGALNRLQLAVTTADASLAAGDYLGIVQSLEGRKMADLEWGTANAKDLVVRLMDNMPVGTYSVAIRNDATNRSFARLVTITAGSTDDVTTLTFPGDTSGTWPTDNTKWGELWITLACGTTRLTTADSWHAGNYIGATGMSNGLASTSNVFEIGDVGIYLDPDSTGVAPQFKVPDPAQNLIECQRYLPVWEDEGISYMALGIIGIATSSTSMKIQFPFKVSPRARATGITLTGGVSLQDGGPATNSTSFAFNGSTKEALDVVATASNLSTNKAYNAYSYNTGKFKLIATGCRL